jgi:hypothetical protein
LHSKTNNDALAGSPVPETFTIDAALSPVFGVTVLTGVALAVPTNESAPIRPEEATIAVAATSRAIRHFPAILHHPLLTGVHSGAVNSLRAGALGT